jgi:hypothetical protein
LIKSLRVATTFAAFAAAAVFSNAASAAYSFSDTNGGDGYLVGSAPSFTLFSADNGVGSTDALYLGTVGSDKTVQFNWNYISHDVDGGVYDPAGYYLNGSFVQLSNGGYSAAGFTTVSVHAGDTFGWYEHSLDSGFGRGEFKVSVVPEPANVALLLAGLGALAVSARRRKSA